MSSYLVLESDSTSKMMRSFPFLSSSFSKSRTLVLFSLPQHHRQWIIVPPPPPKHRGSTEQIVKAALGEETGKSQPPGLRRDSGTYLCWRRCLPATQQTCSPFSDRSYTACLQCPTRGVPQASLFATHGPRPHPHLASLHNSFANFMLNVLGLPAMDHGTLFRATSSHRGVNHMCFQQCNHLGIWCQPLSN